MATAYIESTVPSYYVARPSVSVVQAARQATTRYWWDGGCSGLELFSSLETLDEIGRGEPSMAESRLEMMRGIPLLAINDRVASLTNQLLASGIIPPKAASDAIHIAVATVHEMDFLVTWNFRHIANAHIRARLGRETAQLGFTLPVTCTPEELLNESE